VIVRCTQNFDCKVHKNWQCRFASQSCTSQRAFESRVLCLTPDLVTETFNVNVEETFYSDSFVSALYYRVGHPPSLFRGILTLPTR